MYHRTLLRLLLPVRMQKKVAHDFRYDPRNNQVVKVIRYVLVRVVTGYDRI